MRTSLPASRRRGGFTLVEVVVTTGLIAVLSAFVIPVVIQKAGAADPVKVQNDLTTLQTSLSTFGSDLKGSYPGNLSSLTTRIVASSSTSTLLDGVTQYDATQAGRWNGPYLPDIIPAGSSMPTGFNAFIDGKLADFDAVTNTYKVGSVTSTPVALTTTSGTFNTANTRFVAVELKALTNAQARALNTLIDGADADNNAVTSSGEVIGLGSNTTGRFRYAASLTASTTPQKVYYLVVPLAQ